MALIDAENGSRLWVVNRPGYEVHASAAVGQFGGDGTPDLVFALHMGVFPTYTAGLLLWLDGADGSILNEYNGGYQVVSSPLVIDLNEDGYVFHRGFGVS